MDHTISQMVLRHQILQGFCSTLWQRLFLDAVVLAVSLYGLWVLVRQGRVTSGTGTAAIAQDPVIGIAPLLFAVAITLLLSRILVQAGFMPSRIKLRYHKFGLNLFAVARRENV